MAKARFLVLGNIWDTAYFLEEVGVHDLVGLKEGNTDYIIDLEKNQYFDHKQNKWIDIPVKQKKELWYDEQ